MKTILEFINKGHIKSSDEKTLGDFISWLYAPEKFDDILEYTSFRYDLNVKDKFNTDKEVAKFIKKNFNEKIYNYQLTSKSNIWYVFSFYCDNISFNVEISSDSWDEDPFIKNIKATK